MDIQTVLQKLRPLIGSEEVRSYWEMLQLLEPKSVKPLEFSLRSMLMDETGIPFDQLHTLLPPIPRDKAEGPLRLGDVFYGKRKLHLFGLQFEELIQHIGIFGRTGSGKTNVAFLVLRELAREGFPFLVCDWKATYRSLLGKRHFEELVVYTVGRETAPFYFNPLIPAPGVHPKEWMKWIAEILATAFFLGHGVKSLLQEAIDQLYREFGVYQGSGNWPTFRDVMHLLQQRKTKGKESAWMQSTERAMKAVNFGVMDAVVNSGVSFPVQDLLKQRAVLELDALDSDAKTLLVDSLLLWIHHFRMHEGQREQFKHLLVLEEAHHVLAQGPNPSATESIVDIIFRECREFGQGILFIDQIPSSISQSAMANSYTTIALNLKDGKDISAAGKAMLLDPDEAKQLGTLPVGSGVVKLQDRWPTPFSIRFPAFPIDKGSVTNDQVRQQFLRCLDVQTPARMTKERVDAVEGEANQLRVRAAQDDSRTSVDKELALSDLSENQLGFLQDVQEHPFSNLTWPATVIAGRRRQLDLCT